MFHKLNIIILGCLTGFIIIQTGCISTQSMTQKNSVDLGGSWGGVIEARDADLEEAGLPVDALSGATKTWGYAGVHRMFQPKGRMIEIGLDYMGFNQTWTYNNPSMNIVGTREMGIHQIRLPLTYCFGLFNIQNGDPSLLIKLGLSAGVTFSKSIVNSGTLPDYTFTSWDVGPALGLVYYPPIQGMLGGLGVTCNFYRGSRVFEDDYTNMKSIGNMSALAFGLSYKY